MSWLVFKRPRRRRASRGFTLIEMLVALAVSTLTLSLLTGAGWSLQKIRAPQAEASATLDRLVARRILNEWAGAATKASREDTGTFEGSATRLSLRTRDGNVLHLRIETDAGQSIVTASRSGVLRDVRMRPDAAPSSVLLTGAAGMRFSYLMPLGPDTQLTAWTYVVAPDDGLPMAIAIEYGAERIAVAPVRAEVSGACLIDHGLAEDGLRACALR